MWSKTDRFAQEEEVKKDGPIPIEEKPIKEFKIKAQEEEQIKSLSKSDSQTAMMNVVMMVSAAEDDVLDMQARFNQLDAMDWDDPKFDNDEYENLQEAMEIKKDQLIDLRSKS